MLVKPLVLLFSLLYAAVYLNVSIETSLGKIEKAKADVEKIAENTRKVAEIVSEIGDIVSSATTGALGAGSTPEQQKRLQELKQELHKISE